MEEEWAEDTFGDCCGFMAFPTDDDGTWVVTDCEGENIAKASPEAAILICLILNHYESQIPSGPDVTKRLIEEAKNMMVGGNACPSLQLHELR